MYPRFENDGQNNRQISSNGSFEVRESKLREIWCYSRWNCPDTNLDGTSAFRGSVPTKNEPRPVHATGLRGRHNTQNTGARNTAQHGSAVPRLPAAPS
jgi:hypothetical protein